MFINRTYIRSLNDDFVLNVVPYMNDTDEATPQYANNEIIGWIIRPMYE